MKLIAHRGNVFGRKSALENHPDYLERALAQCDVECDVWYDARTDTWALGHDAPEYVIPYEFFARPGIWVHCKNAAALQRLHNDPNVHAFFHQTDDYTLTSKGYIWVYPNRKLLGPRSIAVMFADEIPILHEDVYGICTDNVERLRYSVVYDEMEARNLALIEKSGFQYDAALLLDKDDRRCLAAFTLCDASNFRISEYMKGVFERLKESLGGRHVIYDLEDGNALRGRLHWTFMQLLSFDASAADGTEANGTEAYKEAVQEVIAESGPYRIRFDRFVLTPRNLLLVGYADGDIEDARRRVRSGSLRIVEPHAQNIIHMTIVRFAQEVTEDERNILTELVGQTRDECELTVDQVEVGMASWRMRSAEISS